MVTGGCDEPIISPGSFTAAGVGARYANGCADMLVEADKRIISSLSSFSDASNASISLRIFLFLDTTTEMIMMSRIKSNTAPNTIPYINGLRWILAIMEFHPLISDMSLQTISIL